MMSYCCVCKDAIKPDAVRVAIPDEKPCCRTDVSASCCFEMPYKVAVFDALLDEYLIALQDAVLMTKLDVVTDALQR